MAATSKIVLVLLAISVSLGLIEIFSKELFGPPRAERSGSTSSMFAELMLSKLFRRVGTRRREPLARLSRSLKIEAFN